MSLYTQHRRLLVRPRGILRVAAFFLLAALLLASADVFVRPFTTPALTVIVDGSGKGSRSDSTEINIVGSGRLQRK